MSFLPPFQYDGSGAVQVKLISTNYTVVSWDLGNSDATVALFVYQLISPTGQTGPGTQVQDALPLKANYKWLPSNSVQIGANDALTYQLKLFRSNSNDGINSGPFDIHGAGFDGASSRAFESVGPSTSATAPSSSTSTLGTAATTISGIVLSTSLVNGASPGESQSSPTPKDNTALVIGCTVGAAGLVVILVAALFFTWYKRKNRHASPAPLFRKQSMSSQSSTTLSTEKALPPSPLTRQEWRNMYAQEMSTDPPPRELEAERYHELEGGKVAELPQ